MNRLILPADFHAIRDAITNHRHLLFTFNDAARDTCPHMLGRKNGVWKVLAWQINDAGKGGFKPGEQRWRCFEVAGMSSIVARDGEWVRGWTTGKKHESCINEGEIDMAVSGAYAAEYRSI